MPYSQVGIIQLITTINSLAIAVPELNDLAQTLIKVVKEYELEQQQENARERWQDKNTAIDAAIASVKRMRQSETQQHGQADKSSGVQICGHCGSEVR